MSAKSQKTKSKKSQSQRFIDKARELGVDEDETEFERKLKRIAKSPPPKNEKGSKRN